MGVLRVFTEANGEIPEQGDSLKLAWRQLAELQRQEWIEEVIPRPYAHFAEDLMQAEPVRTS